jgi:hypothetical protein
MAVGVSSALTTTRRAKSDFVFASGKEQRAAD